MRYLKKVIVFVSILLIIALEVTLLIEGTLRFFPGLIPLEFLINFSPEIRAKIAIKRGLPLREEMVALDRDDGGPELLIYGPSTKWLRLVKDNDSYSTAVMDQNGFCNSEEDARQSTADIITIGDSFTWCHAVNPEEAWSKRLASLTGLSVYNLGVGAIGIQEYLQIFKKFGLPKMPKIVIMNIYEGNDLRDARRYYLHRSRQKPAQDKRRNLPSAFSQGTSWVEFPASYSYACNLFYAVFELLTSSSPEDHKINYLYSLTFSDNTVPFNLENTDRDEVKYAQKLYNQELDPGIFTAIQKALEEYATLGKEHGFIPVVSYTPSVQSAYENFVVFEDTSLKELMPWFSRKQRAYFRQQGEQLGYIFFDLTPSLQEAARTHGSQDILYYRYDLHLTPSGHSVVGEALAGLVREYINNRP